MRKKKVFWFEPLFFLFFGAMHISRIWGLFDRPAYANAWLGLMYGKGAAYYTLMAVMSLLCIVGIITFVSQFPSQKGNRYRWRWVYVCGGGYILFDLFAIATRLPFWENALFIMFDVDNAFWNPIWILFICIGFICLVFGIHLCVQIVKQGKGA